ncbi:thermonuclease family protein [Methylothermus subterraneus]
MIRKISAILALVAALAAVYGWEGARLNSVALRPSTTYQQVVYVYDGDTVKLADGRRVRLLNINAPEVKTRAKDGEPGGEQAKRALQRQVLGRQVRLEFDVEAQDKYGRTLAYLFTADGSHINQALVREGLAVTNIHPPNLKYAEAILAAQREAEIAKRGIWGMRSFAPKPVETLRRAKRHGWQRVQGKVAQIRTLRSFIELEFAPDLVVLIPKANLKWFPSPYAYLGKQVEVRGWPARRRGKVSILVRHPSALQALSLVSFEGERS